MRFAFVSAGCLAALFASSALALDAVAADESPAAAPEQLTGSKPRLPVFGLQLDGGAPDGGVASLVVRPIKWVRLDGGVAYNYLTIGARGGITVVPFHWAIVPTLRLEAGRFFRRDVNAKVASFTDEVPTYLEPAMKAFGYDYASAQVGLEFGSQRRFIFFLRGGLAWIRADFGDGRGLHDSERPDVEIDVSGLSLRASGPTLDLGFLVYVW